MHYSPAGELLQKLGTRPIGVLCAGSFPPPHAPDALATTTSASEAASKSERDLRSTRGKVQRAWDEQRGRRRIRIALAYVDSSRNRQVWTPGG